MWICTFQIRVVQGSTVYFICMTKSKYFIYVCFSYENASFLRAGLVHGDLSATFVSDIT